MNMKIPAGLLIALLLTAPVVDAAGPILVDTEKTGQPVLWEGGVIHYNLESGSEGTLGTLSNEEAAGLVRQLFEEWKNVTLNGISTVSLDFEEGDGLGPVDRSNLDQHFTYCPPSEDCPAEDPPFVSGSARTGKSPILFDHDGSMTDAIQGSGASESILGFAGPRVVEEKDGILYITEGQAILNGLFVNGVETVSDPEVTLDQFKGVVVHELGHFMGIDHTQVNLSSAVKYLNGDESEKDSLPTMFPLFIDGEAQLSLHFDDKVAVSSLYPSADYAASFCELTGKVFESDGVTELQGVNVLAANTGNAQDEVTSFVSGSFYTGSFSDCDAGVGDFVITGLTPGRSYSLSVEKVSQAFTGGSSLEPCDPPQGGFAGSTVPGVFSCSSGGQVIVAGTQATTRVVTTKDSTADSGEEEGAGSGGCALVP